MGLNIQLNKRRMMKLKRHELKKKKKKEANFGHEITTILNKSNQNKL
jgi:hypothetical protein